MAGQSLVAIHQPNFLPWLGYFDKLLRSDVFVLLDDAQLPRRSAGSPVNRVKMFVGGRPAWVTVPVERATGRVQRIDATRASSGDRWRSKLVSTLRANYGRAPAFASVIAVLQPLVENPEPMLATYNEHAIRAIAARLSLETPLVRASELGIETASTQRLIDIVRAVDGRAYLHGAGAGGYQNDEAFAEAGIDLDAQEFRHPTYNQAGAEFEPGLSIVDALMHCGWDGTRALLEGAAA